LSSVGDLPVAGVAVHAEVDGVELIERVAAVHAEFAERLVEGPLGLEAESGGGHRNWVVAGPSQIWLLRHITMAWVPVPPDISASRYAMGLV